MPKFLKTFLFFVFLSVSIQARASIIINETMINPKASSDTYGEWIELYNNENTDIDINQWTIRDLGSNSHQINNPAPLIVPAFGFLVLGRNNNPLLNGGYTPDYVYSSFLLSNTEDEIILENNGTEISRVDYTAAWPLYEGRSLSFTGSGILNNPNDWIAAPETPAYMFGMGDHGTPCAPNVIPEPSALFLWISGIFACAFRKRIS